MKRFLGYFLALVSLPGMASAACSGEWCTNVFVTEMYVGGTTTNWISTSGDESSLTCTPNGTYLKVDGTEAKADWVYSALLTSFENGKPVNVRLVPGSGPCTIAYITIVSP